MKNTVANRAFLRAFSAVHPILFAVFPVLFLYAHNITEASADMVLVPILSSVLGALLLWLLLSFVLRSTLKAGLATTILVVLFFSYGRVYDVLVRWDVFVPRHSYLLPTMVFAWAYCVYLIKIARTDFRNTAKALNVVAAALVFMNIFIIAFHEIGQPSGHSQTRNEAIAGTYSGDPDSMPDIYYIILDEYAHPDTMLEYYDYDNGPFMDELVRQGFFVASASSPPSSWSHRSIASSLNMEYISNREPDESVYQKIANSAVADHLKAMGYEYVYFGSWYGQGVFQVDADVSYNFYESSGTSTAVREFSRTLWNTTMALPFYDYLNGNVYAGHYRSALTDTIQSLKSMPYVQGPKFVFAHVLCPHAPFVFGPNGEYVDPIERFNFEDKRFYLGQYRFITGEIEALVAALLKKSSPAPIIILQSDHGLRAANPGIEVGTTEWKKILNAYHLPGNGSEVLYDSISPVNSFRVILNHYFGADYPLLDDPNPDRTW